MSSSKITSKYQATIPKEVRRLLRLHPGDSITFHITKEGIVVIKRTQPLDKEYLRALDTTLNEWQSESDEEAYEHLQNF